MAMKRRREAGGDIAELGLKWASKRRPLPATDKKGVSSLGYKFMTSRPSARKSRLSSCTPNNTHQQRQRLGDEEDDTEADWVSQVGAYYMTRKKLYAARSTTSPFTTDCSARFSPREHELELDNELDSAWIADYGAEWVRRRCRTRKGQYKVQDDAWLCELGFQWMSKVRDRERATEVWLSDLSSQYMSRRKRDLDRGIQELASTAYRSFTHPPTDSPGETRRKLHYELTPKRSRNDNGVVDAKAASRDDSCAPSKRLAEQEAKLCDDQQVLDSSKDDDEFQVLDFDPFSDLEPAHFVDLDADDRDSSSSFS